MMQVRGWTKIRPFFEERQWHLEGGKSLQTGDRHVIADDVAGVRVIGKAALKGVKRIYRTSCQAFEVKTGKKLESAGP